MWGCPGQGDLSQIAKPQLALLEICVVRNGSPSRTAPKKFGVTAISPRTAWIERKHDDRKGHSIPRFEPFEAFPGQNPPSIDQVDVSQPTRIRSVCQTSGHQQQNGPQRLHAHVARPGRHSLPFRGGCTDVRAGRTSCSTHCGSFEPLVCLTHALERGDSSLLSRSRNNAPIQTAAASSSSTASPSRPAPAAPARRPPLHHSLQASRSSSLQVRGVLLAPKGGGAVCPR